MQLTLNNNLFHYYKPGLDTLTVLKDCLGQTEQQECFLSTVFRSNLLPLTTQYLIQRKLISPLPEVVSLSKHQYTN